MCSLILLCSLLLCISPNLALLTSSSILHNSSSLHLCHEHESSALLNFVKPFTIIDDPYVWKEGTDCCEWEGITCHSLNHHVISLDLSFSGIKGTIESNSSLFLLRHLEYLDLSSNALQGPLPMKILNLPHLKHLDFGYNDGLFSDSPLSNWSSPLEFLALSKVNLSTSLPSSPAQQHLRELDLSYCSIHGSIPTWVWNTS